MSFNSFPKKNPNKKTQDEYNRGNPYMNEKWRTRPYMKWFKAITLYNIVDDDPRFNIPRIGTEEHDAVRAIQHNRQQIRIVEAPAKTALPSYETRKQHRAIERVVERQRKERAEAGSLLLGAVRRALNKKPEPEAPKEEEDDDELEYLPKYDLWHHRISGMVFKVNDIDSDPVGQLIKGKVNYWKKKKK